MERARKGLGDGRYTLSETEDGHVWGVCAAVDGLFGEPRRATYELFGWIPESDEAPGRLGSHVWLVPKDESRGPWLLEDAESRARRPGSDTLVLTGLDDYEGPPEGYRGSVRMHNGHRWLGSCREIGRVLPRDQVAPPILLRGLAPSERLRAALTKGTRKALDLEEAALEVRDDRGEPLTERLWWTRVRAWHPTPGTDLIDLELDGANFAPVPGYARPIWERWFTGPPDTPDAWAGLDTRHRWVWLDLVRERFCRRFHDDRPPGQAYELVGRHITDIPGLYLALGEAVNGRGGYFGCNLDALHDCVRGGFGHTAPATLLWRESAIAREHLSRLLTPEGRPYDLVAEVLDVLAEGGVHVSPA